MAFLLQIVRQAPRRFGGIRGVELPTFILTVNDTTNFETTGNITINMHLTFLATEYDGEFPTHNVTIYENNTIIKKINIGEQNLPSRD